MAGSGLPSRGLDEEKEWGEAEQNSKQHERAGREQLLRGAESKQAVKGLLGVAQG